MTGLLTEDFDLVVDTRKDEEGKIEGLRTGDILAQNQALILSMHKGELKENPAVGAGISDMLLDNDPLAWQDELRRQLEFDGQTVDEVSVSGTGIRINAHY